MKIIRETGRDDLAKVYIAETESGEYIEFAESLQRPLPINEKWVLTISSLYGCPVGCNFCDAGGWYRGKLTCDEIVGQVDFLVERRFPSMVVPVRKFKVQMARVGEPSLNPTVLDALEILQGRYGPNGIYASLSTIAPRGREEFFASLLETKNRLYSDGRFQLQFSIHTTDEDLRNRIIPVNKWDFSEIAEFGERFHRPGIDRKVTLNFALEKSYPLDVEVLERYFDPSMFLIKITPLNPTFRAESNNLVSYIDNTPQEELNDRIKGLETSGYEVLVSIGDREENEIGSNCGQYLQRMISAGVI